MPPTPEDWFARLGWTPLPFQQEAWAAWRRGESGLVHVPTGAGKTYAATLAPLFAGQRILYLSPLRAMARDIELALQRAVDENKLGLKVGSRTGDTSASVRARQRVRPPDVLITTPESLSLLLTDPEARARFAGLSTVVIDEWHELLDSKRGSQVELALSRLRAFAPGLRTWALSATLANIEEAAQAAVGTHVRPTVVSGDVPRPVEVETLLPDATEDLPWSGHLGIQMLPKLVAWLDPTQSTLVFVNTRAQAERWYQELTEALPGVPVGLHHGSIDLEVREQVERGLKSGELKLVVATASLDLGVDLAPVERVVQIGSPKGIARMMQRAGRSGHRPGATSRVLCVPTHALQLVEIAAVREALERHEIEPRTPLNRPLDVLAQHLVTCALGGGFTEAGLREEVRGAWSYRGLRDEEFAWALALVRDGGHTLRAYPEFKKVRDYEGTFLVPDDVVARIHRANVGTIVGDTTVKLLWHGGGTIGTIDEFFISRLQKGDRFVFGGQVLELVSLKGLVATARKATKRTTSTPHWPGIKLPISGSLGAAMRRSFQAVRDGHGTTPELEAARPLFEIQARLSRIPGDAAVLAEWTLSSEGSHLCLFPFEGRRVHEGLAALIALRVGRRIPATFTMVVNDYGLELLTPDALPWPKLLTPELFSDEGLLDDVITSVNLTELMRRRFREIARVAGLVFPGLPGRPRAAKQVQSSASLLYDVFCRYDPENLLLVQARREVLEQHFEETRLRQALARLRATPVELVRTARFTPLAMPLVNERLAVDRQSHEPLRARLDRMNVRMEEEDSKGVKRAFQRRRRAPRKS